MEKILLSVLAILCLALAVVSGFALTRPAEVIIEKELIPADNSEIIASIEELKAKISSLEEFTSAEDEELQNETAKALVSEEIVKKAFLKDVKALLEDNDLENKTIESYKDLEVYSAKIKSSRVVGEDATVIVEIKVKGFEEDDEELDFKAKIIATFEVSDLVVEDEFEDADLDYELDLSRFYD